MAQTGKALTLHIMYTGSVQNQTPTDRHQTDMMTADVKSVNFTWRSQKPSLSHASCRNTATLRCVCQTSTTYEKTRSSLVDTECGALSGEGGLTGNAGGGAGFEPRPGQTIVTEILRGFIQSLQENFGMTPQNWPQPCPPISSVTGLEWPRGFQEEVPRLRDNGPGWW